MSAPVPVGAVLPEVAAELRGSAVRALIAAYAPSTHRLLADLGDQLGLSLAYVDRSTIPAHLERDLTTAEWHRVNAAFTAMDFDDHVGDTGQCRTEWIDTVLGAAGINPHRPHPPRLDQGGDLAGPGGGSARGGAS